MPSTRISKDVWEGARELAERMGLQNERAALEAVFRVFSDSYCAGVQPGDITPPRKTRTGKTPQKADCAAALDAVLGM